MNSSIYLHVFICTAHAQFIGIKGKIPSFYGIRGLNRGLNRGFGKIHGFSSPLLVNRNSVNPWILPNPWTQKSTDSKIHGFCRVHLCEFGPMGLTVSAFIFRILRILLLDWSKVNHVIKCNLPINHHLL